VILDKALGIFRFVGKLIGMNFTRSLFTSLSCLMVVSPIVSAEEKTWAHEQSDIAADSKVTYGELPNGMRYVLMPNQEPPGRVSMRLHIDAGSLSEREDQRGVAHFLEHMVFNGSKSFPDATKLIPQMQRLGISFGAHANAYTSFDETVYMLDLPNNEKDTLELGFTVMRDFGDGALLRAEEIEKERGVILSEKTSRDSVQRRLLEKQFKELLPESLISKRFPIGTEEIISSAPRSAFTDFYSEYYIPERMTFIYVGDFDAAEAEKRIIETFSSMKNPEKQGVDPLLGKLPESKGFQTLVMADKEVDTTDLTLLKMEPFTAEIDNKKNRGQDLPLKIANSIITKRFSILSKEENAPISSGYAFDYNLFSFIEMSGLTVNVKEHDWEKALPTLEQELRRAIQYGFTASEFNEVKAKLINQYEQAVKSASSRKSNELASALTEHIHDNYVFSTQEDDLKILLENLESITPEVCHEAFKKNWDTEDTYFILTTNKAETSVKQALADSYKKSQQTELAAPVEKTATEFAYQSFGEPGEVKTKKHISDLDITQLDFHNGCHCNVKETDFDKNSIVLTARIGGGKLTMPKDEKSKGLDLFSSAIVNGGGLGKHSNDELETILAGKNVSVSFRIVDDAFLLSGATTPEDLELQIQLMCAHIVDLGFRVESERLFDAQLPAIFSQMEHTAAGPQAKLRAFLRGGDNRFVFPTPAQAKALSIDQTKAWIAPALASHYLELSIVGDVDTEKLIPILERNLGALPKREATKPLYTEERLLANLPTPPNTQRYTFDSKIPNGSAFVVWKTAGMRDDNISEVRRMSIVADILDERMREKIREELGEAYSPYAGSQMNDTFTDLGFLVAVSAGKPEQSEPVGKLIIEIADKLANEGATQDELDRALAPRLSSLKQSLRQNSYWLNTVLSKSQEKPIQLDWARGRDADYKSIKLEEINALAKKYLFKENVFRFEIIPEQKVIPMPLPVEKELKKAQ